MDKEELRNLLTKKENECKQLLPYKNKEDKIKFRSLCKEITSLNAQYNRLIKKEEISINKFL